MCFVAEPEEPAAAVEQTAEDGGKNSVHCV